MSVIAFAGCGKPASTPGTSTQPGAPSSAKQVVVGFVSPALTSTFHVTLIEAAQKEGERLGWKVESLAPDRETNFAAQVDMVQALVRRKVNAISIFAINDRRTPRASPCSFTTP
jgi:ribose transport system substrate-binding protein